MSINEKYDAYFYAYHEDGARRSARKVVPLLRDLLQPSLVLDFGCGSGVWLSELVRSGSRALGVDPSHSAGSACEPDGVKVAPSLSDLKSEIEEVDVVLCLEVGEHISADEHPSLVSTLCGLADLVVFSGAVPHQGGLGHVSERWASYWVALFESNGFEVADPFRPQLWTAHDVEPWYKQNMFLYGKPSSSIFASVAERWPVRFPTDVMHPEMYDLWEYRRREGIPEERAGEIVPARVTSC